MAGVLRPRASSRVGLRVVASDTPTTPICSRLLPKLIPSPVSGTGTRIDHFSPLMGVTATRRRRGRFHGISAQVVLLGHVVPVPEHPAKISGMASRVTVSGELAARYPSFPSSLTNTWGSRCPGRSVHRQSRRPRTDAFEHGLYPLASYEVPAGAYAPVRARKSSTFVLLSFASAGSSELERQCMASWGSTRRNLS
jgi:hypothetical protein